MTIRLQGSPPCVPALSPEANLNREVQTPLVFLFISPLAAKHKPLGSLQIILSVISHSILDDWMNCSAWQANGEFLGVVQVLGSLEYNLTSEIVWSPLMSSVLYKYLVLPSTTTSRLLEEKRKIRRVHRNIYLHYWSTGTSQLVDTVTAFCTVCHRVRRV